MSWENDFRNFLEKIQEDPLNSLFLINDWFMDRINKSPTNDPEIRRLSLGHATFVYEWIKKHEINIPEFNMEKINISENPEPYSKHSYRIINQHKIINDNKDIHKSLLQLVLITVIGAYFGGRSLEKVKK